jgi:hypothetical protein
MRVEDSNMRVEDSSMQVEDSSMQVEDSASSDPSKRNIQITSIVGSGLRATSVNSTARSQGTASKLINEETPSPIQVLIVFYENH